MKFQQHPTTTLPIALTMGDVAGIGPEIIASSFISNPILMRGCFVAGDVLHMRRAAQIITKKTASPTYLPVIEITSANEIYDLPQPCLPVMQVVTPCTATLPWGIFSALAGKMAAECVAWAAKAALQQEVAAIITAPLCKHALHLAGPPWDQYPGHTELLQSLCVQMLDTEKGQIPVRMMLFNSSLRVVLVSIHEALKTAIERITLNNVFETITITHQALSQHLKRVPKIAVAGLNPHAGEDGMFGKEEIDIINPACQKAQSLGWQVSPPLPPDTVFSRAQKGEFDVVIAMYHDQGLIPIKYLGIDDGVNTTLGLPILRASPDHGTAFDIAGTGKANPASFLHATFWIKKILQL